MISKPLSEKEFPFKKIDAFATEKSSGNPAGYIRLKSFDEITENQMLQIAKELKGFVSEVGFLAPLDKDLYRMKYYSSEREVDFCGHATIAIMYDLLRSEGIPEGVMIETNRGKLEVENLIDSEDAVFILSPEPVKKESVPQSKLIAEKLKINSAGIDSSLPLSVINAGLTTLIVPISDLETILGISPDLDELNLFCENFQIDIIEVFTSDVSDQKNHFRTRVFAPTFGYLEDPATGSGNSAFGYYLLENKLWKHSAVLIEQNGERDRANLVKLRVKKDQKGSDRICFGGGAINRIEGIYKIYS